MAYPSKFTASYDYSAFAQGQGDNSFPGQSIDTDIANIKATVDDIIDFLKTPLASDGTVTFNGASGGRYYRGVFASSITITEVKA